MLATVNLNLRQIPDADMMGVAIMLDEEADAEVDEEKDSVFVVQVLIGAVSSKV